VDGVAVDGVDVALLVVVEDAVADEGPCADNVAVGEDVALFGVDDEARGLGGDGGICVEGARLAEVDRDDTLDNTLDCLLPLGRVVDGGGGEAARGTSALYSLAASSMVESGVGEASISGRSCFSGRSLASAVGEMGSLRLAGVPL
jgi:hypothetical protein